MPFDANLMFHDGLQDIADASPVLTTRVSGHVVLDLKETAMQGLAVVVVCTGTSPIGACEFNAEIQCSDALTFVGENREDTYIGGATGPTQITNNDIANGCVLMRRIATKKRYVRVVITNTSNGSFFGSVYIMACPYPFGTL